MAKITHDNRILCIVKEVMVEFADVIKENQILCSNRNVPFKSIHQNVIEEVERLIEY